MKNHAKTPALAHAILESALFYEFDRTDGPRENGSNDDLQSIALEALREALIDTERPEFIDRNNPAVLWGLHQLNGMIDGIHRDLSKRAITSDLLNSQCLEDEQWPDVFIDAVKRMDISRYVIDSHHRDFLLWLLEFIRDNRKRAGW